MPTQKLQEIYTYLEKPLLLTERMGIAIGRDRHKVPIAQLHVQNVGVSHHDTYQSRGIGKRRMRFHPLSCLRPLLVDEPVPFCIGERAFSHMRGNDRLPGTDEASRHPPC